MYMQQLAQDSEIIIGILWLEVVLYLFFLPFRKTVLLELINHFFSREGKRVIMEWKLGSAKADKKSQKAPQFHQESVLLCLYLNGIFR